MPVMLASSAWSGVLAGLSGIAAVALAIKARRDDALPLGSLVGFVLTGLAAVSLSAFMLTWGLVPWYLQDLDAAGACVDAQLRSAAAYFTADVTLRDLAFDHQRVLDRDAARVGFCIQREGRIVRQADPHGA